MKGYLHVKLGQKKADLFRDLTIKVPKRHERKDYGAVAYVRDALPWDLMMPVEKKKYAPHLTKVKEGIDALWKDKMLFERKQKVKSAAGFSNDTAIDLTCFVSTDFLAIGSVFLLVCCDFVS